MNHLTPRSCMGSEESPGQRFALQWLVPQWILCPAAALGQQSWSPSQLANPVTISQFREPCPITGASRGLASFSFWHLFPGVCHRNSQQTGSIPALAIGPVAAVGRRSPSPAVPLPGMGTRGTRAESCRPPPSPAALPATGARTGEPAGAGGMRGLWKSAPHSSITHSKLEF